MTDTSPTTPPPPNTAALKAANAASTSQPVKAGFMTITEIMAIADTQVTPRQAEDFQKRRQALLDFCKLSPTSTFENLLDYLDRVEPTSVEERKLFMHWLTAQDIRELQGRSR